MLRTRALAIAAATSVLLAAAAVPAHAATGGSTQHTSLDSRTTHAPRVTVATVSTGLSGEHDGDVLAALRSGDDTTAQQLAAALQSSRPDVVVLTGLDVDGTGATLDALRDQYLEQSQDGREPIDYQYDFAPQTNSGIASGADLDGDGTIGDAADSLGHGAFPGQSSIAVLSTLPIDRTSVRTFSHLLWKDLPGSHLKQAGFSDLAASTLPLQSTSLWDIPLDVDGDGVHLLATATAPAADAEGADELRQRDQLSFLTRYAEGSESLSGIEDDQGRQGPLAAHSDVVVAGYLGGDADRQGTGSAPVRELVKAMDTRDAPPAWGDGSDLAGPLSAPLRRILQATSRATRVGGPGAGRYDYVLTSPTVSQRSSGLEPSLTDEADGTTTRMVWVDVAL